MSTIVDTAGVPDARTPRHRHPGLYVPLGFWVMYVVGIIGCSVDATLARSVINKGFHLDQNTSTVIVVMLGAIAAEAATAAAICLNSGKRGQAVFALVGVAVLGILLAWARLRYGLSTEETGTAQTDRDAGNQTHDEIPATAMMLGLYCVSMISVFLAAIKIFHPARWQLRKHDKQRRKVSQELAPLEADLVAGIPHAAPSVPRVGNPWPVGPALIRPNRPRPGPLSLGWRGTRGVPGCSPRNYRTSRWRS